MHRLVLGVVALFTLGSGAPTVAGQDMTRVGSPAAVTCVAPPLTTDTPSTTHATPGAEETGTTTDASDSEAPLPQRTPPPGTPAGTAVLDRIRMAEENLSRCFNAGDAVAFTALFTPKALLAELGLSDPQATPAYSASYLILREQLFSVSDAQTHADGRLSAEVVFAFEGQRMRTRDIFVEQNGWLLLDETISLGLEPARSETPVPLDPMMLQALAIIGFAPDSAPGIVSVDALGEAIDMQPGDTTRLVLGVFDYEICGTGFRCFVPVAADATWSVIPADGARIDASTGILSIDASTPSGSLFTVRAEIEGGRHVVDTRVKTFTLETNPLIGYWQEEAQLACESGTEVTPAKAIAELIFDPDGSFAVTWVPFESYKDYWGTYTFDLAQGTLELTVTGGNTIPLDVDGHGEFAIDARGRLILIDLWLGTPSLENGPPNCGHRFVR
jgi:hypothetical protein